MQSVALALVTLIVAALAPPSAAFRHSAGVAPLRLTAAARHTRASPLRMSDAEPCMEDEEVCSVEIMKLFDEVKQRAAEAKALENKLKSLQATEVEQLKKLAKVEECELNAFDGCSAFFYDEE